MDNKYSIVNECLNLLKQSGMATIKRLRLEIQLYQIKRLLLRDLTSDELKGGACGEDVFEDLLCQMRRICGGGCDAGALADLTDHLSGMLTVLCDDGPETSAAPTPAGPPV
jgi:hypothetical protein